MSSPTDAGTSGASQRPKYLVELDTMIRARYPLIYLVSWEEQRVDASLAAVAQTHGKAFYTWSITKGLRKVGGPRPTAAIEETREPPGLLREIEKITEPALVVLKDFHPYLTDATVIRALRELGQQLKSTYTTVLFLSPVLTIPVELEKEVSVLDIPLPTYRDLVALLREIVAVVRQNHSAVVDLSRDQAEQLVKAALGLTLNEAENAFAKAIANDQRLDASDIKLVIEEKRQVIRKSGILEYYPVDESLHEVGGLIRLKQWLDQRSSAFTEAARRFGLPEPKGLLLLGVQGCGKSLTAKAIAGHWNMPLLRLDMGRIYSGLVGSSEENLRRAIRVAESAAPCVLWLDEIEKALSGSASSGNSDGGVTARVFGAFLTWMQEKTAPVFVVATANRIDGLPPELLRKGRFDEIFFVDLPDAQERSDILNIHLARRHRDPAKFDVAAVSAVAESFSGAELEQAVVAGLYQAFGEGVELEQRHLLGAIRETFPLAVTLKEDILRLREWAKQRTRAASGEKS
jgi:ATP-dependent 26S proteasome regulatory subunit